MLPIPKNHTGIVKCEFCDTEMKIEGPSKNAAINEKDKIPYGIPLKCTPLDLHTYLVNALCNSPTLPVDVFDNAEVLREERYYIPAFQFSCNADADFSVRIGEQKTRPVSKGYGKSQYITNETYIDWSTRERRSKVSKDVYVSGNLNFIKYVEALYIDYCSRNFVDIEEIWEKYDPPGTQALPFDHTENKAFNEHAVPFMAHLTEEKAKEKLAEERYVDNFRMEEPSVTKDVARVHLGTYRIVYTYGGNEYYLWVTGDGDYMYNEGLPQDCTRAQTLQEMNGRLRQLQEAHKKEDDKVLWLSIITCGIYYFAAGCKDKKIARQQEQAKMQAEIDAYHALLDNVKNAFRTHNGRLRGIYEGV
ncbi:MAG: hypothetical protein FWD35_01025 [Oscillospiraceae bacterium]|nr:hypothetical protein [Oscillospiraceae bacterium]